MDISSSQMESQSYRLTAVQFYSLETWTLQNAETIKSYDWLQKYHAISYVQWQTLIQHTIHRYTRHSFSAHASQNLQLGVRSMPNLALFALQTFMHWHTGALKLCLTSKSGGGSVSVKNAYRLWNLCYSLRLASPVWKRTFSSPFPFIHSLLLGSFPCIQTALMSTICLTMSSNVFRFVDWTMSASCPCKFSKPSVRSCRSWMSTWGKQVINRDSMTTANWEILTDVLPGARKRNPRDCHDAFSNAMPQVSKFQMACARREGDCLRDSGVVGLTMRYYN